MCVCICSTFSNIFSSETTGPIEAKFHVEPPWDGGTKVCSNSPVHKTKMADMPIYDKKLKKSSSPEPKDRWPWNLVCNIGCSSTTKLFHMMALGWPWFILRQGQIWSLLLLYRKKVLFVCLYWGLTSQSTIFQSCRDGATASWVINQYFRGVKCLAQGHNTAAVGFEPPTSRSGVRHSTTEPPRSPRKKVKQWIFSEIIVVYDLKLVTDDWSDRKFLLT